MTNEITLENYRSYPALNYSTLAKVDRNPSLLLRDDTEQTQALTLGSIVDCLMTNQSKFNDLYIVAKADKPTGQQGEFIDRLWYLWRVDTVLEDIFELAYEDVKTGNGGKLRDSLEKFISNFEEKGGRTYFEFLISTIGKTVISQADYTSCTQIVNTFYIHPFTKDYFTPKKGKIILYQHPLLMNMEDNDTLYKVLLDMLIIDHEEKTIQPIDVKTMSESVSSFPYSVFKWRYDIQASLYSAAVIDYYSDLEEQGYEILPFKFMVGSFSNYKVAMYNAQDLLLFGMNGGETTWGTEYKGWLELTKLYKWHIETQQFEHTKELYDSNGEVMLKI